MPEREDTEWLNFWFSRGNKNLDNRVLLIGDSIAREYRGPLENLINKPVDFFATSAYIADDMFWKQFDLFFSFKEYRQSKAHIQIGLHGINTFGGAKHSNSLEEWEIYYEKLVKRIMEFIPDLTIALSTPAIITNTGVLYEKWNDEIIKRNRIAAKIAEKYKLNINDLYTLMLGEPHRDMTHFPKEGSEKIAKKIAESLKLL